MQTYEVRYNDFGLVHVVAESYEEASRLFILSGYGAGIGGTQPWRPVEIHSIISLKGTNPPLISTRFTAQEIKPQNETGDQAPSPHKTI